MILNQTLMFEAGLFATSVLLIYSLSGLLLRSGADPVLQRLRAAQPGGKVGVERIEFHVLAAARHQRQGPEDHHHHQQFGDLQRAGDGVGQELASQHVEEGQGHDREQRDPGKQPAKQVQQLVQNGRRRCRCGRANERKRPAGRRPAAAFARAGTLTWKPWRSRSGTRPAPSRGAAGPWRRLPAPSAAPAARSWPSRRRRRPGRPW